MLFEMWQQTVRQRHDCDALVDVLHGKRLSFGELDRLLSLQPALRHGSVHPASIANGTAHFVVQTLRAWRDGAVLCPHESQAPDIGLLRDLPATAAHVKTTSGSTGESRFVLFSESQLHADMVNISSTMGFDPSRPNLGVISVAHSYGFSHLVLPLLIKGMPLWHVPNPLPETMRASFSSGESCFLPAVPAMWRAWHQTGVLKDAPILLAMSAGAPLPLELERQVFDETGVKIHNFYGASECGGIAYDATHLPRDDAALVGTPLNGVILSTNEDGCMVVGSSAVGLGYWPPEPQTTITSGCVTTSDLAEITANGVRLVGRVSDTVNIAGRKVSPTDIETALLTCPDVRHCVVFGVPSIDPSRVEEIVACVNVSESLTPAALSALLTTRLNSWQIPRRWWITSSLMPDERGKISRAKWRARFLERSA